MGASSIPLFFFLKTIKEKGGVHIWSARSGSHPLTHGGHTAQAAAFVVSKQKKNREKKRETEREEGRLNIN